MRIRTSSNGARHVVEFCPRCGHYETRGLRAKNFDLSRLVEIDRAVTRRWSRERTLASKKESRERAEWWANYNTYLSSHEWRATRKIAMDRANYRCEARLIGCMGTAHAVHHLTYVRVFREIPEDLQAVCSACHDRIHEKKIHERR